MDELIKLIAAKVGISEELAKQAVGIILTFLNSAAPPEKMDELLNAIDGARDYVGEKKSSMFGGMMGAMAAMNELTGIGLGMGEVQGVTKETVRFAREKAGEDTVNAIVAAIPGLSQFV